MNIFPHFFATGFTDDYLYRRINIVGSYRGHSYIQPRDHRRRRRDAQRVSVSRGKYQKSPREAHPPASDLCVDVYGLRNLIVQMGHKDGTRPEEEEKSRCVSRSCSRRRVEPSRAASRRVRELLVCVCFCCRTFRR